MAKLLGDRMTIKAKSFFELIPCYVGRLFGVMTQYVYEDTFSFGTKCSVPRTVQILRALLARKGMSQHFDDLDKLTVVDQYHRNPSSFNEEDRNILDRWTHENDIEIQGDMQMTMLYMSTQSFRELAVARSQEFSRGEVVQPDVRMGENTWESYYDLKQRRQKRFGILPLFMSDSSGYTYPENKDFKKWAKRVHGHLKALMLYFGRSYDVEHNVHGGRTITQERTEPLRNEGDKYYRMSDTMRKEMSFKWALADWTA